MTISIDQKIVGQELKDMAEAAAAEAVDPRTRKTNRTKRNEEEPLPGWTYTLSWPHNKRKIYMTCNYVLDDMGRKIPLEMFFEGGDPHMLDVLKVISRQTSSILQRGGDILYLVKDFIKNESSQQAWVKPMGYEHSINVTSFAALVGYTLVDFFYRCDFPGLAELCDALRITKHKGVNASKGGPKAEDSMMLHNATTMESIANIAKSVGLDKCPECGQYAYDHSGGCPKCRDCGYTKCS